MPERSPRRRLATLAPVVLTTMLSAGCALASGTDPASRGGPVARVESESSRVLEGAQLSEPYHLAEATLTDTDEAAVDVREGLDRAVTLVFFGYTSCPDICPATMATITAAMGRLTPAEADRVGVWFVTTDPARDTPRVLRDYLDRFDPEFVGLTGSMDEVVALADSVHIPVERGRKLPGGGYEVTHGTPVLAVLPDGEVPVLWTEGTSPAALASDLETLVRRGVPDLEDTDPEGQS